MTQIFPYLREKYGTTKVRKDIINMFFYFLYFISFLFCSTEISENISIQTLDLYVQQRCHLLQGKPILDTCFYISLKLMKSSVIYEECSTMGIPDMSTDEVPRRYQRHTTGVSGRFSRILHRVAQAIECYQEQHKD